MRTAVEVIIIALFFLGALSTVDDIGKPREPITNKLAVCIVILSALLSVGILYVGRTI